MIQTAYRGLSHGISPLAPLLLRHRLRLGRENPARLPERLGHPALPRPNGPLIWLHAASVGEAQSVLRLIRQLQVMRPAASILITTGTVTSATMLAERLPPGVIHQFIPLDLPRAVARFINHWRPDTAIWIESELWPNLILEMDRLGKPMAIINGRMSERSFSRWQLFGAAARRLLAPFDLILGQNAEAADRYKTLGGEHVRSEGNLKYAAEQLPARSEDVSELRARTRDRHVWIAASVHPGEDSQIAAAHHVLKAQFPDLLTIVAPRHPTRGGEMARLFTTAGLTVAQRSLNEPLSAETGIYVADTMGELGLLYSLEAPVFVGGSLIRHGGQNILEPARFGRSVLTGPHTWNFSDVVADMRRDDALIEIESGEELGAALGRLLRHVNEQQTLGQRARIVANRQAGVLDRVLARLEPLLPAP